jgi:hypothetical protein
MISQPKTFTIQREKISFTITVVKPWRSDLFLVGFKENLFFSGKPSFYFSFWIVLFETQKSIFIPSILNSKIGDKKG